MRPRLTRIYRLVHRLEQGFRRRFTPAGLVLLGALIAAAVIGIDTRQNLAYQLVGLCLGLLLTAALAAWRPPPRCVLHRELPRYASLGEPLRYRLLVTNQRAYPEADLRISDQPAPATPFDRPGRGARFISYLRWLRHKTLAMGWEPREFALPPLPPARTQNCWLELLPLRRGYLHFQEVIVARPDPLGLCNSLGRHPLPGRVLVLPQRHPVAPFRLGGRSQRIGDLHLAQTLGHDNEFRGLRDYRSGDPPRHVHWRSLARLGRPVTKEFQATSATRQALVLDSRLPLAAIAREARFEAAVQIAASLCAPPTHRQAGDPDALLDLVLIGTALHRITQGRGLNSSEQQLAALACAQPDPDSDYQALLQLLRAQGHSISACVVILLDWDAERRPLVDGIRALGCPCRFLVITPTRDPLPADLYPVDYQQVARDLAAWRPEATEGKAQHF